MECNMFKLYLGTGQAGATCTSGPLKMCVVCYEENITLPDGKTLGSFTCSNRGRLVPGSWIATNYPEEWRFIEEPGKANYWVCWAHYEPERIESEWKKAQGFESVENTSRGTNPKSKGCGATSILVLSALLLAAFLLPFVR